MPPDQLRVDRVQRRRDVESPLFLGDLAIKHGLQQVIAQLLGQMPVIPLVDRVQQLIRLFERVGLYRIERLLAIPGAAVRRPQAGHNIKEPLEFGPGG